MDSTVISDEILAKRKSFLSEIDLFSELREDQLEVLATKFPGSK
jgi:hypothetical protein